MQILVVLAHPLKPSLSTHFADRAVDGLRARGHEVRLIDLYAENFDPALTPDERRTYYTAPFPDRAGLTRAEALVLVFPTWWFGLPAILKGWIDRSFLPGVAYDHASDLTALTPRLDRLRHVLAITTLGSPGWIDRLILRRPLRRMLKWGLFKACAPKARFRMISLYKAENAAPERVARFTSRLDKELEKLT